MEILRSGIYPVHTVSRLWRHLHLAALAATAALLTGCATGSLPAGYASDVASLSAEAIVLGPGDKLRIVTFNHENLTGEFKVSGSGKVAFPLVGDVEAEGLTTDQLQTAIATALQGGGYVVTPYVTAEVIEYRPFYVLGEVNEPGSFGFVPGLTAANAIATAGGFSYRANQRRVYIRRAGATEEVVVPLTATTPVFPGDTVRIAERYF